jgi:hypothetical protein
LSSDRNERGHTLGLFDFSVVKERSAGALLRVGPSRQARDLYADTWLGFSEVERRGFLEQARFRDVQSWIVDREKQTPSLETILAVDSKLNGEGHGFGSFNRSFAAAFTLQVFGRPISFPIGEERAILVTPTARETNVKAGRPAPSRFLT